MELKEIYKPIAKDLEKLEKYLCPVLDNDDPFISELGRYISRSPGKRLRPALVFLCSRIKGKSSREAIKLAAAVEIIHTATLIHDDIIDKSPYRRGKLSAPKKWGTAAAILYGDYLFSKAFELIVKLNQSLISRALFRTTNAVCEGELWQLKNSSHEYLELISKKTASLFAFCCEGGALLAGCGKPEVKTLKGYGHNLGMLFQMVDDCNDSVKIKNKIRKTDLVFFAGQVKSALEFTTASPASKSLKALVDYVLGSLN